jgi:hypothetical protein
MEKKLDFGILLFVSLVFLLVKLTVQPNLSWAWVWVPLIPLFVLILIIFCFFSFFIAVTAWHYFNKMPIKVRQDLAKNETMVTTIQRRSGSFGFNVISRTIESKS